MAFILGGITDHLIFKRGPDVSKTTDEIINTKTTSLSINKNIKTDVKVAGAKEIYKKPDGSITFLGPDLSYQDNSEEISQLREQIKELSKEKKTIKNIEYRGSVFIMWNTFNLKPIPSMIGISYSVFNPLEAMAIYDMEDRKLFIGVMLRF
jgi:hypothetical protein